MIFISSLHFQLPSISKTYVSHHHIGFFHFVPSIRHKSHSLIISSSVIVNPSVLLQNLSSNSVKDKTEVGGNLLAETLRTDRMPKHLGVILDGNMRWAKKHNLTACVVHERLLPNLTDLCHQCIEYGIPVLSAFIFSIQNWSRPRMEVDCLMNVYVTYIKAQLENFMKQGIRISFIGGTHQDCHYLSRGLKSDVEEATKDNTKLHLIYAMGYNGQYEMMQACQSIADKVKDGLIQPQEIDESVIEQHLQTNCTEFSHPDLVIRTGGKLRVSNFFLWQFSYSELFFAKSLWPDFEEVEFIEALCSFQERRSDFGKRVQ